MPSTLFISEYICGGALADQELPPSLAAEGGAMLAAAVADLSALPGIEVTTTLDGRLCQAGAKHTDWVAEIHRVANVIDVSDPGEETAWFHRLAGQCDATLVIAPEFDGILYDRCRGVEQTGSRLLGSSSEAVALASDKYRTNRLLAEHGIPATESRTIQVSGFRSQVSGFRFQVPGLRFQRAN